MSSANRSFYVFLLVWMIFIYFSCPFVLTGTSNTMMNRSDENGNPCLTPDLRGKAYGFYSLIMMLGEDIPILTVITSGIIHNLKWLHSITYFLKEYFNKYV